MCPNRPLRTFWVKLIFFYSLGHRKAVGEALPGLANRRNRCAFYETYWIKINIYMPNGNDLAGRTEEIKVSFVIIITLAHGT